MNFNIPEDRGAKKRAGYWNCVSDSWRTNCVSPIFHRSK